MLTRLKTPFQRLRRQLRETAICLALGLKDSLRLHLLWRGLLLAALLALSWLVVFVVWRDEIWSVSLPLGGAGVATYLYPFVPSLAPTISNVGVGGAYVLIFVTAVIVLAPVAAAMLIVAAFLGLFLLSFRWLSLRSLFPRVKACVERQYLQPCVEGLSPPAWLSWAQHLRLIVTAVIGTAVCLLAPLTVGLFLLLWIGYLSTRSMALQTLKGTTSGDKAMHLVRHARLPLTLIGACMSLLLLVPLFGLTSPTAMAAATAHLMKRSLERRHGETAN